MITNHTKEQLDLVREQLTRVGALDRVLTKINDAIYDRDSFINELNFREEHGATLVYKYTAEKLRRAIGHINRQLSILLIEYTNLALDFEEFNAKFQLSGEAIAKPQKIAA